MYACIYIYIYIYIYIHIYIYIYMQLYYNHSRVLCVYPSVSLVTKVLMQQVHLSHCHA